jgi:hypothetical protein
VQISGRIVALQEQRFRLLTDSGQVYLLTLGRDAPLDASALAELHARGAHLDVDYTGEANLANGVAHVVREDGR